MDTQVNDEGEVRISVEPQNISAASSIWNFKVTMDTHSVELSEDLRAVSELVVNGKDRYAPIAWEGSPAGGHHRSGVLKFSAITPLPQTMEIRIFGGGGVKKRLFYWTL